MRFIARLSTALALAACAGQQAQVLPPVVMPVRIDTSGAVAVLEPAEPAAGGVRAGAVTALGDPFARIDRMDWPGPNEYRAASGATSGSR